MRWIVFDKDGLTAKCEVRSLQYSGEFMGACSITAKVVSPNPVDFEIGDYLLYRGERFEINYDPTVLKQASSGSYGEGFVYDNIVFNSLSDELTRCDFLDYVPNDNNLHYSSLPNFSFFADSVQKLAERIQVNLDRIYTGDKQWTVNVNTEKKGKTDVNVVINNQTCWDALALVKSEFGLNFIVRGRTITIGTEGIAVGKVFSYGKGNGLISVERNAESDQKVITRLRAYGSTKNMPESYYKNVGLQVFGELIWRMFANTFYLNIPYEAKLFTKNSERGKEVVFKVNGEESTGYVTRHTATDEFEGCCELHFDSSELASKLQEGMKVYFTAHVNKTEFPRANKEYAENVPNNMAVRHLMLPSFPTETTDPYIDSENIGELGIREATIFFDGSNGNEEIYPSMEGMTAEDLKAAGVECAAEGALDEVVNAEQIEDDGFFKEGSKIETFKITLKDVGFDINDHLSVSGNATIAFNTGMCGGRDFEIVECKKEGANYVMTCNRHYDESLDLYFPYKDYQIKSGDKFVLINIEMPDVYVQAASQRLLTAAKWYLGNNDYVRYSYVPRIDNIFLAREHDEAVKNGEESIHDTIKEGDLMLFHDTDLGIEGSVIIDSLSIREGESLIPEYEVTLRNNKTVGTITKIQNQIDSIVSGKVGTGGGYNAAQIKSLIDSYGQTLFLSKTKDDRTSGSLGVGGSLDVGNSLHVGGNLDVNGKAIAKKGVQFGESFVPGILTGLGGNIDERGNAELESLVIRRFLEVPELRYNRVEVKLGDKWNASGAGIFESVAPDYDENGNPLMTGTGWLKLEDGEIGAIAIGDICMGIFHSMNSEENATEDSDDGMGNFQYSGFYTCYFTITEITGGDNKEFRYQMRPISDRWKLTIHPSEAMTFVAYGSFTRADRQTSMYQTRTYTRLLKGQNTWEIGIQNIAMQYGDLSNMNIHGENLDGYSLYCNNMYFTGKIQQMKPNGEPILTANDRGEWVKGTKHDFYDRVSHDGGLWLCINESGTNTEPKDGDSSWLCQVKSGQSVTAAGRWESSKVPYAANSIVTFHEKVFISNKETSAPPFGIYTDKDENRLTFKDGGYILVDTLIQSEDWDLLLDAPDLVDGKDGESVQVRYSSDKSNWHATFAEGDVWMQQRVGDKAQWSDPIRIAGEQGAAGADGTYYDYQFAVNDSLDVAPTTGWQDTPPKVGIGQYLWMRTRFVDPNSQVENPWSVARIGGEKGRGVEKVTEYYQVSASNTIPPTTWVKDEMPEMTDTLKYLWNYEEVAYTDTEVVKTSPIVIGMYSKDGNGIKSVTETYGLTNSAEEQPTKWYADMPIPNKEVRYLWNKTVTEYTEGAPTTIIRIIAVHGETGDSIKAVGSWKSGLEVPALGVVTMAGKTFMAKVATMNPPMWIYTDKETNRFIYKNGGYILTGEMNTEEYELLVENGKDGADGKDYEYIYIHSKDNTRPATPASVQIDDNVPNGWHDDPIGVSETFPYEWVCVRTKKDGVWSDYSAPAIWAKFGMDAILADLDNEMDNVALGADGKTTSKTTIAITAAMYYGSAKQALTAIQVGSVQGITSSYVLNTGVITLVVAKGVTLNERTEVPITLTSSINGKTETRTLKFTLAAVKGGADGKDAVLYDIVTSVSSIGKRKDGSYTVSGVSAVRMKTIGEVSTETTDGKLKYSIDGGTETEISNNQTIASDKIGSKIQFFFYNAEGVVVDKESVPMVVDGADGEGFTMMGNWKTGLSVPKMGVVTMGGQCYASKGDTKNPPLWCWTDKDGNRLIFSATEYILTGESNTTEYEQWSAKGADGKDGTNGLNGERGEKGDKGEPGKQGIQGCIVRDSEWAKGVEYRNDEDLKSGTRYIDIAMVRSDATATGWKVYKCKVTHTSSDDNKPENSTYWEAFGASVAPIFTSLIIAKNAKINFLQGNQLLMQKNDGTVTAGLSGSEEGEKVRIWSGSDIPDNAPFNVTEEGVTTATKFRTGKSGLRLEAENGLIRIFGNLTKNIEFGVDDEGLAVMRYFDNDGVLLYDLGPNGISAVKRDNDKWVLKRLTYLGIDEDVLFGKLWPTAMNPYYFTGEDRFQFLSGYVGGAYNDLENNRKIFKTQSKTDGFGKSNVVEKGWYCDTLPKDATESSRMQFASVDGRLPDDMNELNPHFNTSVPVYVTSAFYIENGFITKRMNVYYNLITV